MSNFWPDLIFYLLVGLFYGFPVFAVAFAAVRYGLNRFRPREPHPKRWALLTAGLVTPLLCWGGLYAALFLYSYYPHRSFNPGGWEFMPRQRYEMVAELQTSRRLIGLKPEQVSKLLGLADYTDKTSWSYHLGTPPGLGFSDGQVLVLEFRNNKVFNTRTYEN